MFYLSISSLIFNLIDVLCVILPMLLGVAFMTIIERKALAAFQRRVGPNTVGWDNKYLKDLCLPGSSNKRFFHSTFDGNNDIINALYENRIDSCPKGKLFDSKIVDTFYNLTSTEQKVLFFNKYNNKGGIYLIQYKDDLSIYYIGRAKNFKNRLNAHLKTKVKDKFHLFANLVVAAREINLIFL